VLSPKLRPHVLQPFTIASDDDQVMAVGGEKPGQLQADPVGGARDQRRPVLRPVPGAPL